MILNSEIKSKKRKKYWENISGKLLMKYKSMESHVRNIEFDTLTPPPCLCKCGNAVKETREEGYICNKKQPQAREAILTSVVKRQNIRFEDMKIRI